MSADSVLIMAVIALLTLGIPYLVAKIVVNNPAEFEELSRTRENLVSALYGAPLLRVLRWLARRRP